MYVYNPRYIDPRGALQYNTPMLFGASRFFQLIKEHFQTVVFSVCTLDAQGESYTTHVVAEPVYGPDGKTIVSRRVFMDIARDSGQYRRKTYQLMAEEHFQKWYFEFA